MCIAERGTRKLRASIRVHDQSGCGAALCDRHLERPHRDPRIPALMHRPTHNTAAVDIEQRRYVEPALASTHVASVTQT